LICLDVNWKILFMLREKLVLVSNIGRHHRKIPPPSGGGRAFTSFDI
jgi:hypothetical protein